MPELMVNIDHVATLREARGVSYPDPVYAACIAEEAGAAGIIVHLREDRRHIKDRDVRLLKEVIKTRLNLEMAATDEMVGIAAEVLPYMVTLVPEKRQELTTEGGLEVAGNTDRIAGVISKLREKGVAVSLFIDADEAQVKAAQIRTRRYDRDTHGTLRGCACRPGEAGGACAGHIRRAYGQRGRHGSERGPRTPLR